MFPLLSPSAPSPSLDPPDLSKCLMSPGFRAGGGGGGPLQKTKTFDLPLRMATPEEGGKADPLAPKNSNPLAAENLVYGVINAILTIPCMYGYAAIIFSDPVFSGSMPFLCKLVLFSSVVHQGMFTLKSTLPFSIGQVQDAGLIFLSSMTSSIVAAMRGVEGGEEPEDFAARAVATSLVCTALCTMTLGAVLVVLGKKNAAQLVSYLPMPVVGGYLAFIGLFCFLAGIGLCTSQDIPTAADLVKVASPEDLLLCAPAVIFGALMMITTHVTSHPAALPLVILATPLCFYLVLLLGGIPLQASRDAGWVDPLTPPCFFTDALKLFRLDLVEWSVLPQVFPTWVGMTIVVAFSSCLDVLAIETDMGSKLDISKELTTVGWSNVVSGCCGGFTGSYIFSQTIFTYRTKTNSRTVGLVVFISELLICLLPLSVVSYVPNYFFAATLIFIAIDLMVEWLVWSRRKMLFSEFVELWVSFLLITVFGINQGLLLGLGVSVLTFVVGYSRVKSVTFGPRRSTTIRSDRQVTSLSSYQRAVVSAELSGYLFFGTSLGVLSEVSSALRVSKSKYWRKMKGGGGTQDSSGDGLTSPLLSKTTPPIEDVSAKLTFSNFEKRKKDPAQDSNLSFEDFRGFSFVSGKGEEEARGVESPMSPSQGRLTQCVTLDGEPCQPDVPTQFLVLDFSRVSGLDVTAARGCFHSLANQCRQFQICTVFCGLSDDVRFLLEAAEVLDEDTAFSVFADLDHALEACEDQILLRFGGPEMFSYHTDVKRFLQEACQTFTRRDKEVISRLSEYLEVSFLRDGQVLYRPGEPSDSFYICAKGTVSVLEPAHENDPDSIELLSSPRPNKENKGKGGPLWRVIQRARAGAIFGEVDFAADRPRSFSAKAEGKATVYCLSRETLDLIRCQDAELYECVSSWLLRTFSYRLSANFLDGARPLTVRRG